MIDVRALKTMPLGQSEWSSIQADGLFFVDKTALLLDLVKKPKVFLSRPRRYGKTLLLSMIEDLFNHGTQNFQNTAICDMWPEHERYPVVRLSFINVPYAQEAGQAVDDVASFEAGLIEELGRAYQRAGFAPEEIDAYKKDATLHGFLSKLSNFSNQQRLVFLIDEWDVPLSAHLDNEVRFDALRRSLNVFYNWLRTLNLRFLLVTGIMRYKETNLFTGRDIVDLSMHPKFSALLGYTQQELEHDFADYLELAAQRHHMSKAELLQQLKFYYNGFCFDEDVSVKLYCPWAINSFFEQLHDSDKAPPFRCFWMNAVGDPKSLRTFMERVQPNLAVLDEIKNKQVVLGRSDLINPTLFSKVEFFPLLTLNGYLTIQEAVEPVSDNPDNRLFVCGFPNYEVKVEFEREFLNYLTKNKSANGNKPLLTRIAQSLLNQDISTFCNLLNELFRSWRYDSSQNNIEVDYRSFITLCLALCDKFMVREETGNNKGRSDIEVELPNTNVYVFELKRLAEGKNAPEDQQEMLDAGQKQMLSQGYGVNHATHGKHVTGVIIVISTDERQIVAWRLIDNKIQNSTHTQDGTVQPLNLLNKPEFTS